MVRAVKGDILHIVVPEICGGIVGVEVIENQQSFDDPINVCFSTTRGVFVQFTLPASLSKWREIIGEMGCRSCVLEFS